MKTFIEIARKYGPKAAAYLGGPAAGATVAALVADEGAFTEMVTLLIPLIDAIW